MTVPPLKLEEFLPFRLSLASNLVSRRIAETYEAEFGLSTTQWRVMAVLGEYPGMTATELTQKTALDKVAVSRAATALINRGLLQKKTRPDDNRRAALSLTEPGQRVYGEVIPRARRMEADLLKALPKETLDALDKALSELTAAAEA